MVCNHPEAFVSIKNGQRVCGICGGIVPEPVKAPAEKPAEKAAPKKGGKNARN